jgi:hypothetical protein
LAILVTATIASLHHARARRTNRLREVSRRQIMSEAKGNSLSCIIYEGFNLRIEIDSMVAMFEHWVLEAGVDSHVVSTYAANVSISASSWICRCLL